MISLLSITFPNALDAQSFALKLENLISDDLEEN